MRHPLGDYLKRFAMFGATMLTIALFYGLGKLNLLSDPIELTLTRWDIWIPFIPWTVWFYGTVTYVIFIAWMQVPLQRTELFKLYAALSIATICCSLIFVLWPTTYPRHLYPLELTDSLTAQELMDLREIDSPSNCLPSLHVALAWSLSLSWLPSLTSRWLKALPLCWALIISICTLTTKQHYLIDIPAGALVGVSAWAIVYKMWPRVSPWFLRPPHFSWSDESHKEKIKKMRTRVERHQWSLDEIQWPTTLQAPMDPTLIRLINEIIYIEEIAGFNFQRLAQAAHDQGEEDLEVLYQYFAQEERRHADGLRHVLRLHCAPLRAPGLGNTIILDEFASINPKYDMDICLIAMANPVFETFLDAGTIPFLRNHPALKSEWFDDFVSKVCRDESLHIALNWIVIQSFGKSYQGWRGLRLLLNPTIYKGILAMPFMALDVYTLAHRLGYDFKTLYPPFKKLWRMHKRYPQLKTNILWWFFRLFTIVGYAVTLVADTCQRLGVLMINVWTSFTRCTDLVAHILYGDHLLDRCELPRVNQQLSDHEE